MYFKILESVGKYYFSWPDSFSSLQEALAFKSKQNNSRLRVAAYKVGRTGPELLSILN